MWCTRLEMWFFFLEPSSTCIFIFIMQKSKSDSEISESDLFCCGHWVSWSSDPKPQQINSRIQSYSNRLICNSIQKSNWEPHITTPDQSFLHLLSTENIKKEEQYMDELGALEKHYVNQLDQVYKVLRTNSWIMDWIQYLENISK